MFRVSGYQNYIRFYFKFYDYNGPSWSWSYGSWIYNYIYNQYLSPLTLLVRIPFRWGVLDKTLCDQVCQWLATGLPVTPGTPVSSTNKTDRHDITEILLYIYITLNLIFTITRKIIGFTYLFLSKEIHVFLYNVLYQLLRVG
jgi:hypothetical protein